MKKRIITLIIFSLIILGIKHISVFASQDYSQQEIRFPQTPAGQRAADFFDAFVSMDEVRLVKFLETCLPEQKLKQLSSQERARKLLALKEELGEVRAIKTQTPSPGEIVLFFSAKKKLWQISLSFETVGQEVYLKALTIDEAGPEALLPPPSPLTQEQALEQIEREVGLAVAEDKFSGVVLIAKDFQAVFFKAWGLASRDFAVPNRPETKFNLGSINKIFTKIAIGQLIEKKLVSCDDKIGQLLLDYPNPEAKEKVKVRHLVEMTSGIGDFFGPEFQNTPKDFIRHNQDYLKLFATKPLAFEPGKKQLYSNGSYVVLGEIIAKVSGMDYYNYVRKNIFEVAGMKDSAWYQADELVPNLAEGYTREISGGGESRAAKEGRSNQERSEKNKEAKEERESWAKEEVAERAQRQRPINSSVDEMNEAEKEEWKKQEWRRNIYTRPARGSAAGGGYSTAEDLLRFIQALHEEKLLSPEFTDWVFGGPEPQKETNQVSLKDRRKNRNIALAGGAPGINAVLEFDGRVGRTIIVLSNLDPPSATAISQLIRRYLPK